MTTLEIKHIEFLQKMIAHRNEDLAQEAQRELKELKAQYSEKGIFII